MKYIKVYQRNGTVTEVPEKALPQFKNTWKEMIEEAEKIGVDKKTLREYEIVKTEEIEN